MARMLRSLLFLFLLTAGALSQSAPYHAISGTVNDPSGAAIEGAQVSVVASSGALVSQTTTDGTGTFRLEKIDPGNYQLEIEKEAFRKVSIAVSIGTKSVSALHIVLPIAVENHELTVQDDDTASQVGTDMEQNQNSNTVDRAALDRVPVFDQDYVTTLSRFLDDSATGTNGVTLVVNGVEANGPGVTASAVQEVKINQNPYSALFSRPGRARIEITTKGGTPKVHGSMTFMLRNAVFDAGNAFATVKPSESRQYYEGSLTGPLGHKKGTTFLLSLSQDRDDSQAIVLAQGINGIINDSVLTPNNHFFGSGRVFHDFTTGDKAWVGYSYENRTMKNQGVGGEILREAGTNSHRQEHEINFSFLHIFSPQWINQLRFLVGHYEAPTTSLSPSPQIIVSGAFTGGGAQADSFRTEFHLDGNDMVSVVSGRHDLKFGIDIPDISRRGAGDFTNTAGTYTFDSLAAYQANQPSTYLVQRGQGHLVFVERVLSGFVEDNIRLRPNLSMSLGMRYDFQSYFHDDANNFGPRLGVAFQPSVIRKTVIRGGAGIFYDRTGPRPIADLLHFNGTNLHRFIVNNPTYPVSPDSLVDIPSSVVVLDPRARIPYTIQYSSGLEHQVGKKSTLSATYIGSRGINLLRSVDANAPSPPSYLFRPKTNLGQERELQARGYQKSSALELIFRGQLSKYFNGQAQYTFGKTYNNTSGVTYFPANSYDPSADWARSDNDRRHKFDLLGSTRVSRFFTLGLALSLYSGKPVNITTGGDDNRDGIANDRPTGVLRNTLPGPDLVNLDVNLTHDFVLSKRSKEPPTLAVSLNSFNVFNHENNLTYVGVITSPFFGQAVQAQPPRRMQLDVKFKF